MDFTCFTPGHDSLLSVVCLNMNEMSLLFNIDFFVKESLALLCWDVASVFPQTSIHCLHEDITNTVLYRLALHDACKPVHIRSQVLKIKNSFAIVVIHKNMLSKDKLVYGYQYISVPLPPASRAFTSSTSQFGPPTAAFARSVFMIKSSHDTHRYPAILQSPGAADEYGLLVFPVFVPFFLIQQLPFRS